MARQSLSIPFGILLSNSSWSDVKATPAFNSFWDSSSEILFSLPLSMITFQFLLGFFYSRVLPPGRQDPGLSIPFGILPISLACSMSRCDTFQFLLGFFPGSPSRPATSPSSFNSFWDSSQNINPQYGFALYTFNSFWDSSETKAGIKPVQLAAFNSFWDSSEGLYLGYILWLGVYIGCGVGLPLLCVVLPSVVGAGGPKPPLTVQKEPTSKLY